MGRGLERITSVTTRRESLPATTTGELVPAASPGELVVGDDLGLLADQLVDQARLDGRRIARRELQYEQGRGLDGAPAYTNPVTS